MRNFLKIGEIDPLPLLHALACKPELWNANSIRTFHKDSLTRNLDDILLRFEKFEKGEDLVAKVCSELDCVNMPVFYQLPQAQSIVFGLMARVMGERLGRVFISRLGEGKSIAPHSDIVQQALEAFPEKIVYADYYSRYQIALKASPGVVFRTGDEQLFMRPGEIWWFNNLIEHEVINNSDDDRISMVVDIRNFTQ